MYQSPNGQPNRDTAVNRAISLLAHTLGVGITLFAFGPLHAATLPVVEDFLYDHYPDWVLNISGFVWGALLLIIVFGASALGMMLLARWLILKLS